VLVREFRASARTSIGFHSCLIDHIILDEVEPPSKRREELELVPENQKISFPGLFGRHLP